MHQKGFASLVVLLIIIGLLILAGSYFTLRNRENLVATPQINSDWQVYTDSVFGFQLKYPKIYQIRDLEKKDSYPFLNYEKGPEGYKKGFLLVSRESDLSCPSIQILIYDNAKASADDFLLQNQELSQGYSNYEMGRLGDRPAHIFTYPAGDLVPTKMYLVSNDAYIFQIHEDNGLKGDSASPLCGDILSTFKP